MNRRRLGRTGLQVPEVGLGGAWLLGRNGDRPLEDGVRLVRAALEQDIDYLDTAECYIDGRSEAVLGAALDAYEAPAFVATKFGHRPQVFDFSRESVLESIAESRRLLGGRTIDLIQVHTPAEPSPDALFGPGGALDGMREARERGWCRWFGITGRDVEFLRQCVRTDQFDTLLLFLRYDLVDQSGTELLQEASDRDLGIIAASPLRMGMLGTARDTMLSRASETERQRIRALEELFGPDGVAEAAYRFILARPEVSVMLAGATSEADLANTLTAARAPLAPDQVEAVREIARRFPGETPL